KTLSMLEKWGIVQTTWRRAEVRSRERLGAESVGPASDPSVVMWNSLCIYFSLSNLLRRKLDLFCTRLECRYRLCGMTVAPMIPTATYNSPESWNNTALGR